MEKQPLQQNNNIEKLFSNTYILQNLKPDEKKAYVYEKLRLKSKRKT